MNLFAYGTLMDEEIMTRVTGRTFSRQPAMLPGYVRKTLRDRVYPGIIPRTGSSVTGLVYLALDFSALAQLDRYEDALYQRVQTVVRCATGQKVGAWVYVVRRPFHALMSGRNWSLAEFQTHFRQAYVAEICPPD